MGCHFLLQGIFPNQESNSCLLHLLHWRSSHKGPCGKEFAWEALHILNFCFNHISLKWGKHHSNLISIHKELCSLHKVYFLEWNSISLNGYDQFLTTKPDQIPSYKKTNIYPIMFCLYHMNRVAAIFFLILVLCHF